MDIMVAASVAILFAVIVALIGLIKRKRIGNILIHTISGLIIGFLIGYVLAPTIISFV